MNRKNPQANVDDDYIDSFIEKRSKNLSSIQKLRLKVVSEKTWFRQYAKESKSQLKEITKKKLKQIKEGHYSVSGEKGSAELKEEQSAFKPPKVRKEKKKQKEEKAFKKTKSGKKKLRSYSPETTTRVERAQQKYPDASNYELRHGVNSKLSQQYRLKHGLSKEYKGRIILKE